MVFHTNKIIEARVKTDDSLIPSTTQFTNIVDRKDKQKYHLYTFKIYTVQYAKYNKLFKNEKWSSAGST